MKRQLPFLILIGVGFAAIIAMTIFGEPVQNRIDRCEQRGGVYLRHESICVRLEKINIDQR